jgi:hypothetical protein
MENFVYLKRKISIGSTGEFTQVIKFMEEKVID